MLLTKRILRSVAIPISKVDPHDDDHIFDGESTLSGCLPLGRKQIPGELNVFPCPSSGDCSGDNGRSLLQAPGMSQDAACESPFDCPPCHSHIGSF